MITNMDPAAIIRYANLGLTTQYTAVQIFMAHDEWTAANSEYEAALAKAGSIDASMGNDTIELIGAYQNNESYRKFDDAVRTAANKIAGYNPLATKTSKHSHESFPVDKTMKSAAQLRKAAKQINNAVEAYRKAVR